MFGQRTPELRCQLPLDKIECAGSLKMQVLTGIMGAMRDVEWVVHLLAVLIPSQADGWCGYKEPASRDRLSMVRTTHATHAGNMLQLCASSIFRRIEKENARTENVFRIFWNLFLVPKSLVLARVIMDCRLLDELCEKPPPVRFATLSEIFALVFFFASPVFAVIDFRHWFYEISLPSLVRHLFSGRCDGSTFESLVFPMGFSWSPWVAQCIATIIVMHALKKASIKFTFERDEQSSNPPPVIIVRNASLRIVAFIFIWYDNITIIAMNTPVRDCIASAIDSVCTFLGVVIKAPGIITTKGAASILGFELIRVGTSAMWRHNDENCEKWQTLVDAKPHAPSARQISELLGVIIWNWQLSGDPIGTIEPHLDVSRRIGKKMADIGTRAAWDLPSDPADYDWVKQSVAQILQEQWAEGDAMSPSTDRPRVKRWRERFREVEPPLPGSIVFAASDAMNLRGAGVRWVGDSCMVIPEVARSWNVEEQEEHINWKECQMAIDTVNFMLDSNSFPGPWEIVLGVDNSTTKFAMTSFFFPTCPDLTVQLLLLAGRLHHCDARLTTVHVPGVIMAADAPSRLLPLDAVICAKCLTSLKCSRDHVMRLRRVRLNDP